MGATLVGFTAVVNKATGQVGHHYSSGQELDGHTYVKCGNRRAAVCPSCSAEYKGDAWHLILCGLAGGKGIPETVARPPVHLRNLHRAEESPQRQGHLASTLAR